MKKYFGGFNKREDVVHEFQEGNDSRYNPNGANPFIINPDFPTDEEILFAAYEGGSYEGAAVVLFERDGKLYEVNGGHCSCCGLEDQWIPEETSWEAINLRPRKGPNTPLSSWSYDKDTIKAFWDLVDSKLIKREG